jgi:hypothetical protein
MVAPPDALFNPVRNRKTNNKLRLQLWDKRAVGRKLTSLKKTRADRGSRKEV